MADDRQQMPSTPPKPPSRPRRRGTPAAVIGILSVLIPAAIFAYVGWRSEVSQRDTGFQQLNGASPKQVVLVYFQAAGNAEDDLVKATLSPRMASRFNVDPGLRGVEDVRITSFTSAENSATAVVRFVTVRPLFDGQPPGPLRQKFGLARSDERWRITSISPPER